MGDASLKRPLDLLSRKQVARICRCSEGAIRHMERKGLLKAKMRDESGKWWFDPATVHAANVKRSKTRTNEARRAGALAAAVYSRLRDGMAPRDVVIELSEPPEVVDELVQRYRQQGEALVPADVVAELGAAMSEAGMPLHWEELPARVRRWIELEQQDAARQVETATAHVSTVRAVRPRKNRSSPVSSSGKAPRSAQAQ